MNHRPVLLFAGTSEGRELAEYCIHNHIPVWASAATEYGEFLLPDDPDMEKLTGYLDETEIEKILKEQKFSCVIDATHPYAVRVTENLKQACEAQRVPYYRVLRGSQTTDYEKTVYVSDINEAVEWLNQQNKQNIVIESKIDLKLNEISNQTEGHIFDQTDTLTGILAVTGSKELSAYDGLVNKDSLFVRVLPSIDSLKLCAEAGIPMSHIIAMQGPFSVEANAAVMKQYNCGYMVTKESGQAGGFAEKIEACRQLGAVPIVIRRPVKEQGMSMGEMKDELTAIYHDLLQMEEDKSKHSKSGCETFAEENEMIEGKNVGYKNAAAEQNRMIIIAGIGMGNPDTMTQEVRQAILSADAVIGGKRMVEAAKTLIQESYGNETEIKFVCTDQECLMKQLLYYESYLPEKIAGWIKQHEPHHPVVLMSGDTGFYSGTKKLLAELEEYEFRILPGISSIAYLSARFGLSWEDACICSIHGRKQNVPAKVRTHEKVFSILGKGTELQELCQQLTEQGMGNVAVYAGSHLSYPEEQLWTGTAEEAVNHEFADLCAVILLNTQYQREIQIQGIPEEEFIRDKVPMTKEEIRVISLAKLHLTRDAVVYDIGAGTGSVSVEAALATEDGRVYAIERKPLAADLIRQNCQKFGLSNVTVVEGIAPEALTDLPVPTHVFIGGSSGKLKELIAMLYEKNQEVRIVVNAIALETIGEISELSEDYQIDMIQIQVAKSKEVGKYHLMMGQNPVMIAVICGRKDSL